jgi:16S rRNA (guanine966-N2)-methyltransferase
MSLRIIGGTFKNRLLKCPNTVLTKPTMSLMRKSVFDICQGHLENSYFLDLFACSGAMGIEALSRGAAHATFIEKDRKALAALKENIKTFELEKQTTVLLGDVFSLIPTLEKEGIFYDIVYIDPPYPLVQRQDHPILALLQTLDALPILKDSSLVFLEEGAPGVFTADSLSFTNLKHKNTRRFGDSLLHQLIFKRAKV